MAEKKINPIRITKDGKVYVLEFSRETVSLSEQAGFTLEDAEQKMMTRVPELFYFAFKMHHPEIKREETDAILFDDLGGLSREAIERLVALYSIPYRTLINEGGKSKNFTKMVAL